MKKPDRVFCLFEQSGTFKQVFLDEGIIAYDVDIENNFSKTDLQCDLFQEIDKAWRGEKSIFTDITSDDLILAFFPCTFFSSQSGLSMNFSSGNMRYYSKKRKYEVVEERARKRLFYYLTLLHLFEVIETKGLRMILENPWHCSYLAGNFIYMPTIIDYDRSNRGDMLKKPTAYWFVNCSPGVLETYDKNYDRKKYSDFDGFGRSIISPKYAKNFVYDFILEKKQTNTQLNFFNKL